MALSLKYARASMSMIFFSGRHVLIIAIFILFHFSAFAQDNPLAKLKALSIEELMDLEVTSVSRGPEKLSQVASAIQVITQEDIARSGATNVPEALRLATNLQVAQVNSSAWIISARGFNTVFANKLLVLIDGRSVYTPLFGGVLWEMQHVLLEDVEQIEIISGPGGTMWGANAVNGVINIITKKAKDAQGVYVSASGFPFGDNNQLNTEKESFATPGFLRYSLAARYGAKINEKTFLRVYAQTAERSASFLSDTARNSDDWKVTHAGFRMGTYPTNKDFITVQGDVYQGVKDLDKTRAAFDGQNILTRWTRTINDRSDFVLQMYYDRYYRNDPSGFADELWTYDLDFQYRYKITTGTEILSGIGYRHVQDHVMNRINVGLLPNYRTMPMYTAFVQSETSISKVFKLTIGSKFQHNFFTGVEFQPSARLAASLNEKNVLWAAISEAVRTPSRLDVDYYLFLPPDPAIVKGDIDNFVSEKLKAYELGYRTQPTGNISVSLSGFYNEYRDVYSVESLPDQTLEIMNGSAAETWGGEFSGLYQPSESLRLRGGFTYFDRSLRPKPGRDHDPSYLMNDAKHQFLIQSMLNLSDHIEFDLVGRYLDYIPASFATARVSEYFTFDARLAYKYKFVEVALVGQNLWSEQHSEFQSGLIQRSVYGKVTCRF
jgi:iron complex outermembrane receptor protein